jgi:hypothetical protein
MNSRSFLMSILISGIAIGLLGSLPLLNLVNCVLCIWVWLGGALSVFLYRRAQHGAPSLTTGQAAALGALAGLVGAIVGALVFAVTSPISTPLFNSLARGLDIQGDLPTAGGGFSETAATTVAFLVLDAVLYPLFGALGGMIAAATTRARAPAESRPLAPEQ